MSTKVTQAPAKMTYVAAPGANQVVNVGESVLKSIIIGGPVIGSPLPATGIVEVSDHASDGDGNLKVVIEGAAVGTVVEVHGRFQAGLTADITGYSHVTFVWDPA